MTRIIVVDNDTHSREMFAVIAEELGATVHFCRDGLEALGELRARGDCDLIIADLHTPRLDGLQLLRIKAQDAHLPRIPVIITSGSAGQSDVNAALAAGAAGFLAKPASTAALRALLEEHLGVGLAALV